MTLSSRIAAMAGALALVVFTPPAQVTAAETPWFAVPICATFKPGVNAAVQAPVIKTDPEHLIGTERIILGKSGRGYDAKLGLGIAYKGNDSYGYWIVRKVGPPPAGLATPANLASVQTTHGARIGWTAAALVKKFGTPLIRQGCGMSRYYYTIDRQIGNSLEFTLKDGHVIEIYFTYGD